MAEYAAQRYAFSLAWQLLVDLYQETWALT